jgi:ATP adenylyltransferase
MQYIQKVDSEGDGCVFCLKPRESNDRENLILYRGAHCFVVLNLYPYNNGHFMVVPYRHTSSMAELRAETVEEMWKLAQQGVEIISREFRAEGFNIGLNLGRIAGAGIDQHLHLHVVPRWNGDTNFMPVISQTKVISQALAETYDALHPHFNGAAEND